MKAKIHHFLSFLLILLMLGQSGLALAQTEFLPVSVDRTVLSIAGPLEGIAGQSYSFSIDNPGKALLSNPQWGVTDAVDSERLALNQASLALSWQQPGLHKITLTANLAGRLVSTEHQIWLYTPVQARFDATVQPVNDRFALLLSDRSSGDITKVTWDFGDGQTSGQSNPVHYYLKPGMYTVSLTAAGPGGEDTSLTTITIPASPETPQTGSTIFMPAVQAISTPYYAVTGHISDGAGNPVEGVTISDQAGNIVASDPSGKYSLNRLLPGMYTLDVAKPGYTCAPAQIEVSLPPDNIWKNVYCSTATYNLTGQVLASDGSPMAGLTVTDNVGHYTTTDSAGAFTFEGLPAGIYTISPAASDVTFFPEAQTVALGGANRPVDVDATFKAQAVPWLNSALGVAAWVAPEYGTSQHSLQVGADGYPRIAFAGVNLYYGVFNGSTWNIFVADNGDELDTVVEFSHPSLALDADGNPQIAYYDIAQSRLRFISGERSGTTYIWRTLGDSGSNIVDNDGDVGKYASLAIWDGKPHIAYLDETNDNLKYAYFANDLWHIEVVDSSHSTGAYPSLAFNSAGFARISYHDFENQDLRYAIRFPETGWGSMVVVSAGRVGQYSSLAVDSTDEPHIAYFDEDNDAVRYASYNFYDNYWTHNIIDNDQHTGVYISLAIDSLDNLHLSFYDMSRGDLKYAFSAPGGWKVQALDSAGDVGLYTSIALDYNDTPHFLYYSADAADLKYTTKNLWEIQIITVPGAVEYLGNRNLQLDEIGLPRMAVGAGGALYYAYFDGSAWVYELVDGSASVGNYASMVLDTAGSPHISYFDAANGELKYAFWDTSIKAWQVRVVDPRPNVGYFTSIILDSKNRPHIAYFDEDKDNLKYAYWNVSYFEVEEIDSAVAGGTYPSIDLDSFDQPRISYFELAKGNLKYAYRDQTGWHDIVVDSPGVVGYYTSLVIDPFNNPHISYFDDDNDDLKYAYHDGLTWHISVIDKIDIVGMYTAMALDNFNNPHIGYYDYSNGNLKYAHWDSDRWVVEVVDSTDTVGENVSIVLDNLAEPHFLYKDVTMGGLRYASRNKWSLNTVAFPTDLLSPSNTNIQLDQSGFPHAAYGGNGLYYASYDGVSWNINLVDGSASVGGYASLALDEKTRAYISYYDAANGDLKFARQTDLGWLIFTIDSTDNVGLYTSIVLDQETLIGEIPVAHIAYFDETNDNLKYAVGADGIFTKEIVNSTGSVGTYSSIALNSSGSPRISYFDLINQDLLYAVRLGSNNWSNIKIATTGDVGFFSSLAVDSYGNPHIAYFDDDNDDLKYAYYNGLYWHYQTVDTFNSTGWYISLALDTYNRAHISYYDYSSGDLKHAVWTGYAWMIEIVDGVGDVGLYTSIFLDKSNRSHIFYYDTTNLRLKYAAGLD